MLRGKERNYFENLVLRKMSEAVNFNIVPESLKIDAKEKFPDLLDQATLNHNRNITILLIEKNNIKIDGFKNALERIREGSYGICEGCGERISKRRLEVMPFTSFCVSCQRENEMRPIEVLC